MANHWLRGSAAILSLLVAPACKTAPAEGVSDAAPPEAAIGRIGTAECTQWADHGVSATFADWKSAAGKCPTAMQTQLSDRLEGQRVSVHQAAIATCAAHMGEGYATAEARCYMAATTVKALADCHFRPMTHAGDTDLVPEIDRLRAQCGNAPASGSGMPGL
jgi:hypothetical protein